MQQVVGVMITTVRLVSASRVRVLCIVGVG